MRNLVIVLLVLLILLALPFGLKAQDTIYDTAEITKLKEMVK